MGKIMWDMIERTTTGPIMSEDDFENELFPTVIAELVAKHKIEFDPNEPIMSDPDMADAIFKAGMELLMEVGLYCKDTKRLVKFTESELWEVIRTRRHTVTLGTGREAITLDPRTAGDPRHPFTWFPAGAYNSTDVSRYTELAKMVAQEPTCDGLIGLPLMGVGDKKLVTGTPAQALKVLVEGQAIKEAALWAGRPGFFLGFPMSATTPLDLMHAFESGIYTKDNAVMSVQVLQDLRINYDRFNQAFFAQQAGIEPWMSSSPTLYAYLAGPEQAAVEIIAHTLAMMAFSDGSLTQAMSCSVHGTYQGNDITWTNSAASLAAERNIQVPWISFGSTADPAGALSDDTWIGTAIACITACVSGMEALWICGGSTALECRMAGEVTRAAAPLSAAEGTDLIKRLSKIEKDPSPGLVPMEDLYDFKNFQPKELAMNQYKKMAKIFKEEGLSYPTWE